MKYYLIIGLLTMAMSVKGQTTIIHSDLFSIRFNKDTSCLWQYVAKGQQIPLKVGAPKFEIDQKLISGWSNKMVVAGYQVLSNGVFEKRFEGLLAADTTLRLVVTFRWSKDNPVIRFRYTLLATGSRFLTKKDGYDALQYASLDFKELDHYKEIRLSEFNEKVHATYLREQEIEDRYFENGQSVMGPIIVGGNKQFSLLMAYEHGSQFPDKFVEFRLKQNHRLSVHAVKGNYYNQQPLDPQHRFETIWFELGATMGSEKVLASHYRNFVLHYLSEHLESRKPYIFYNTWGRQERVKWGGGRYLSTMDLKTTLKEIEMAHQMGIEVYVIDAGWFDKTGDWNVNKELFPDSLRTVKKLLDQYGMKLGLWFNPLAAALSSTMLQKNKANVMTWQGKEGDPFEVWETEKSVKLSLVSSYWEDFANKLIALNKTLGVTYFKWDAIGQYGSDAASHFNGMSNNSSVERSDNYAFQLPIFMSKVVDKVCQQAPQCIFDFDITEEGRCVGLSFLASGKYFIMNNGPYFHNFDLAPQWKSPLPNGNANIFVHPGPARGWFTRSALTYDKWIPSILFLTHYQPDGSFNSKLINLASLVLGQNGIWGEISNLKEDELSFFQKMLTHYKAVRQDINLSDPVRNGEPGGSPEIYEKINKKNGRGAVVIFANAPGTYTYITEGTVSKKFFATDGVKINLDSRGRAIIEAEFKESSAKVIFFGTAE